jgi:hypothetical protein
VREYPPFGVIPELKSVVRSPAHKWTICVPGLAVAWLKEASAGKVLKSGVPGTVLPAAGDEVFRWQQ